MAPTRTEASLYDGLAGDLTALWMLAPAAAAIPLRRLEQLRTVDGWVTTLDQGRPAARCFSDLVKGTAGVVLAAVWAGGAAGRGIALAGCDALVRAAETTESGLDWGSSPGDESRGPNYSHGTAGIASSLAVAGAAFGRPDLVHAAALGAQHLLAIGSADDGGFVVPHTIPPSRREVEPITYTWCHGPAGTSHLFAALAHAGLDTLDGFGTAELRQRCLSSILGSGVLERAIRDDTGVFWRFIEHRQDPPLLPPGTSWMQGAAGIAAFLLRLSRVLDDGMDAPVVDRPDQWWAVPAELRTSGAPRAPMRRLLGDTGS